MRAANLRPWIGLALLTLPIAWLARRAGFPAAFMLGPMVAAIGFSLSTSTSIRVPRPAFLAVQALLGCAIARSVTASFLDSLKHNGPVMVMVVLVTILSGAFVGWLLIRYGALPGTTAAWGSSPGGASAMVAMAHDYGADTRLVGFMQYLRVVLVVLTATLVARLALGNAQAAASPQSALWSPVPWLPTLATLALTAASGYLGFRSRLPAGALIVPMLVASVAHAWGMPLVLPPWLLALGNLVLGWQIGLGFGRDTLRSVFRAVPQLLGSTVLLISLCAGMSWVLTRILGLDPLTAYLATSPGGLDSIAIIALGSEVDLSFVMAAQTLRLLFVLILGPHIARWLCRFARTEAS